MIAETFSNFLRSLVRAPLAWLLLAGLAFGTEYAEHALVPLAGPHRIAALGMVLLLRLFGVIYLGAVIVRRLVGTPARSWRPDRGLAWYLVWELCLLVAVQASTVYANRLIWATHPRPDFLATAVPVVVTIATALVDLASLIFVPWIVARTTRTAGTTAGALLRGGLAQWMPAAGAYAVLVLPPFVLHVAASLWLRSAAPGAKSAMLFGDALLSVPLGVLLLGLYVAMFARAQRT